MSNQERMHCGKHGPDMASSRKLRPSVAKPPGAVSRSPREGAWQAKPATSSCRAFRAFSTHGRWPRPRGSVARERPPVETAASGMRNREGRLGAAPGRGLGKRSPQLPVAGRFVRSSPTGDGRGRGALGTPRPAVGNCGLREAKPPGAVQCSPREGAWQMKPATSSCRAFCAISTHG